MIMILLVKASPIRMVVKVQCGAIAHLICVSFLYDNKSLEEVLGVHYHIKKGDCHER